jgi:iron complex transport system substrate-binding protein
LRRARWAVGGRAALAALLLAGAACDADAEGTGKPQRIMSMMICTDALLLSLVPAERITSVTFLARSPGNSLLWDQARRVPINHGLAEEVLAQRPDLVLAGTYTTPATRAVLKELGLPLLEVPQADDFEQIRQVTRHVAHAVGEEARGEALLARMDATLRELALTRPSAPIRVLAWEGDGSVPGQGTLFDAILRAAGGINIAALPGPGQSQAGGSFGIERLLLARPDVIAYGDASLDAPSLRTTTAEHPLIMALYGRRRVSYPELLYSCGLPQSAEAARTLRAQLRAAMSAPGPAP